MATTRLTIVSTAAIPTVDEHSALYLPIWAITPAHKGRKIRTDGQCVVHILTLDTLTDHPQSPRVRSYLVSSPSRLVPEPPQTLRPSRYPTR